MAPVLESLTSNGAMLGLNSLILLVQTVIGGYVIRMDGRLRRIEQRSAALIQKVGGIEE